MTDLYLGADRATESEAAAVDSALRSRGVDPVVQPATERLFVSGTARRRERRHYLLPALHALQNHAGWISPGGINYVAEVLGVPPAEAFGVATFYDLFRTEPPDHGGDTFHVCVDAACQIAGYDDLAASVEASGGHVHRSPCLGPVRAGAGAVRSGRTGPARPCARRRGALRAAPGRRPVAAPAAPHRRGRPRVAGVVSRPRRLRGAEPGRRDGRRGGHGRGGRRRPVGPGRGGVSPPASSGGPSRAETGRPKHVVANCDESEPGTFKDRIVMEHDPFAVVEAMTIAGFATGANNGWIYIRGEYPQATARLQGAIDAARAAGLLGNRRCRHGPRLRHRHLAWSGRLHLRRGDGAVQLAGGIPGASPATSHRSPPRTACSASRPRSTTPRRSSMCSTSSSTAPMPTGRGERSGRRGTRLLCMSGHVGPSRPLRGAVRNDVWERCWSSRAGSRAPVTCRRC